MNSENYSWRLGLGNDDIQMFLEKDNDMRWKFTHGSSIIEVVILRIAYTEVCKTIADCPTEKKQSIFYFRVRSLSQKLILLLSDLRYQYNLPQIFVVYPSFLSV